MDQDPKFVQAAFASIARRYVLTNHVLSLGIDILWRRRVARQVASWNPSRILDLATGTGDLALAVQKKCPDARVLGVDFCAEMLQIAEEAGVAETRVADAMNLPFEDGSFDVVTVAFGLRNMESWSGAAREMRRVLRPGGHLLVLDFSLPTGFLRKPYLFYLRHILPRIAGFVAGSRQPYIYLAESIQRFPSGQAMRDLLSEAGFEKTAAAPLSFGIASIYTGRAIHP